MRWVRGGSRREHAGDTLPFDEYQMSRRVGGVLQVARGQWDIGTEIEELEDAGRNIGRKHTNAVIMYG